MKNLENKRVTNPIRMNVTRIQEMFEMTNPYKPNNAKVIKDYVYIQQKRVLA